MKYLDITPNLHASQLILGCMRIRALSASEIDAHLAAALDLGINFFDHADIYGETYGQSEQLFGDSLRRQPGMRGKMIIQSKCGIDLRGKTTAFNFDREYILQCVEGSLARLGIDRLDVLLLHRPDALMEPDEIARAFDELETTGKVANFGVSNFDRAQVELVQSAVSQKLLFNQLQFGPAHTGMIDHAVRTNTRQPGSEDRAGEVLDYCRRNGVTVQAWSPFHFSTEKKNNGGVFIGHPEFKELNQALEEVANAHGLTVNGAVSAWICRHPANIQTISGTTNRQRLAEVAAGMDVEISREEWYRIYTTQDRRLP